VLLMATAAKVSSLTLYAAADALDIVRDWLSDPEHVEALVAAEGDLDALPELRDLLDQAEMDFKVKAERVALVAQEKARRAKFIGEEIDRLQALKKADESAAAGLKRYLLAQMTRANVKKVDGTLARPRVQANPPAVKCDLTPERIQELHQAGCPFTLEVIPEPVYSLPASGVLVAYKEAVEQLGAAPDLGEPDYPERLGMWQTRIATFLLEAGVPIGVRVERGAHVRIS
jgi:hypothetical protein